MTVSHAIVILLTLTCQLTPKSNSHISLPLVAIVYKLQHFQCLFTSNLQSNVSRSTRINSSSVYTYIFVCFTLGVILQGFVDPIMQQESMYLNLIFNTYRIREWSFTIRSVKFARSGRNAYRKKLNC